MPVKIMGVEPSSPAEKAGLMPGDTLISINGAEINDVLDYGWLEAEDNPTVTVERAGERTTRRVAKTSGEKLGLCFEDFLMDEQRSCRNSCVFCFIDQLPKGLRESLYFKDDDSRLSFLLGNYITLTNLSEREVERIISMKISPINVSVHTTNPELRVKMMRNRFAGESLKLLKTLSDGGIKLNCQLVLLPGVNDGGELRRTLSDLLELRGIGSVAAVPVGLTGHREGLRELRGFSREEAAGVLSVVDEFRRKAVATRGEPVIYAADEFYILAGEPIPGASYYGDFPQLEDGVGMWAMTLSQARDALRRAGRSLFPVRRTVSVATGEAAEPLIREIAGMCEKVFRGLKCVVYAVPNRFFGGNITVSGLLTESDIAGELRDKPLGDELLFPRSALRREGDLFLDGGTPGELEAALGVKCTPVGDDGAELVAAIRGKPLKGGKQ